MHVWPSSRLFSSSRYLQVVSCWWKGRFGTRLTGSKMNVRTGILIALCIAAVVGLFFLRPQGTPVPADDKDRPKARPLPRPEPDPADDEDRPGVKPLPRPGPVDN